MFQGVKDLFYLLVYLFYLFFLFYVDLDQSDVILQGLQGVISQFGNVVFKRSYWFHFVFVYA